MKNKIVVTISSLFLVVAFAMLALVSLTQAPDYDSSYNLSVSKNLAGGLGYSTSYDQYYFNNHEITTGTPILIPTAVFIKVFGNETWVPVVMVFAIAGLFLFLIILEKRFFNRNWRSAVVKVALFLLFLLVFVPANYFTQIYGEVPSTLLVIIGSLIYFSNTKNKNVLTGLIFGVAFLIKTITIILFIPVVLDVVLKIFARNLNWKTSIKKFSAFLVSFLATVFTSSLILTLLNPQNFPKKDGSSEFFLINSGIRAFLDATDKLAHPFKNIYRAINALWVEYGHLGVSLLVITLIVVGIVFFITQRKNSSTELALNRSLFTSMFLFASWWFLISIFGWTRHLMPSIIIFCYLISGFLMMSESSIKISFINLKIIPIVLLVLVSFVLFPKNYQEVYATALTLQNSPRLSDLIETKAFVENFQKEEPSAILLGCGDWYTARDLEYVLDSSLNFVKCEPYLNSIPLGKVVYLVRNEHYLYLANQNRIYKNFTEKCDEKLIYKKGVYMISRCS